MPSAGTYLHQHLILRLQTYNFARRVASLFSTPERLFYVCFRAGGTCTMSRGVVSAAGAASTLPTDNQIGRMICEITGRSPARPYKASSVASLVRDGQDTILVAATGYGKSAVLYTFATMTKKITLQIVPLTKLGQNQRDEIEKSVPGSKPVWIDQDTQLKVCLHAPEYTHTTEQPLILLL